MKKTEFIEWVKNNIKSYLPEVYEGSDAHIEVIRKLGETYTALVVRNPEQNMSPAIDLDNVYEDYDNGMTLERIMKGIARSIVKSSVPEGTEELVKDYSKIKERLFVRLSNAESNEEVLKGVPHKMFVDLAVTYHIMIEESEFGFTSATVTNALLESLGVTAEQLDFDAKKNSQKVMPVSFGSLTGMLFGSPDEDPEIMVITNQKTVNGASAILYDGVLQSVADKLQDDLFILPSSVHEVLAIRAEGYDWSTLEMMVRGINREQVLPEDRLSDRVYYYNRRSGKVELAAEHFTS